MKRQLEETSEFREKWRNNWESARKQGPIYFIFFSGLVYWGGGTFAALAGLHLLTNHWRIGADNLCEFAITSVAVGLAAGVIDWHRNEDLFYKLNEEKPQKPVSADGDEESSEAKDGTSL